VVFRGIQDGSNQLKFITDARSQKVQQMQSNPWAEVCWYFPKTREQFRISGRLILICKGDPDPGLCKLLKLTWQDLSDAARLQFAWPEPAGSRSGPEQFAPPLPEPTEPLANFCVLLLEPSQVDHLELRGEPQNRCIYVRGETDEEKWSVQLVNP
jgi:PPOX class probable FMN-dependent enzyme